MITRLELMELDELVKLEKIIERGRQTFVDVGIALAEIRDKRLYRESFGTFEEYCKTRWGFSRRHSYRLLEASEIADDLCPMGHILNERTAREFTSIPKEDRPAIAESAKRIAAADGRAAMNSSDVKEAKKQFDRNPDQSEKPILTEDQARRLDLVMDGFTQVANISKDKGLILLAEERGLYVRIDRNTIWGNPFILDDDGDRETVIENYEDYLTKKPSLQNKANELRGKLLGCWCYPENCHAHALIKGLKL